MMSLNQLSAEFKPHPILKWILPVIVLQLLVPLAIGIWAWPLIQSELEAIGRNLPQTAEQLLPDFSISELIEPLAGGLKRLVDVGQALGPDSPLPILVGFLIIGMALIIWLAGSGLILSQSFILRNNHNGSLPSKKVFRYDE